MAGPHDLHQLSAVPWLRRLAGGQLIEQLI